MNKRANGWWLSELVGVFAASGFVWMPVSRGYSDEERRAVRTIGILACVMSLIIFGLAALLFHFTRIEDPLDIHVGIEFFIAAIIGVWLGRKLFVLTEPELARTADENAERRLSRNSRQG